MTNLYDLVDVLKNTKGNENIKAILPDNQIIDVGPQQYVESDIYFMFAKSDDETIHTATGLKANLEYEASEECWGPTLSNIFDGEKSNFLDCEMQFANCNPEDFVDETNEDNTVFDIKGITIEHDTIYLHCEDNFVNNASSSDNITSIPLTDKEKEMINHALNAYGCKLADSQGYNAAEPYWNLMHKFS